MPLALQLHLVRMSKYSKFGTDTLNTFWVMGYINVFAQQKTVTLCVHYIIEKY